MSAAAPNAASPLEKVRVSARANRATRRVALHMRVFFLAPPYDLYALKKTMSPG